MNFLNLIVVSCSLAALPLLGGCGGAGGAAGAPPDRGPAPPSAAVVKTKSGWSPDDVSFTCASDSACPDNQGVLLSLQSRRKDGDGPAYVVKRCTATAYAESKILTAGHCAKAMADADQIFFKTASKSGRASRTFKVKRDALFAQSLDENPDTADYAALELESSLTDVEFAHPLRSVRGEPSELLALVANTVDGDFNTLRLEALPCRQFQSALNPLTYARNPSVFQLQACSVRAGNSGGVVVRADDLNSVLGVLQSSSAAGGPAIGSSDPTAAPAAVSPPAATYSAGAANARCFSLPGWPRAEKDCVEINKQTLKNLRADYPARAAAAALGQKAGAADPRASVAAERSPARLRLQYEPANFVAGNFSSGAMEPGLALMPVPSCLEIPPASREKTSFTVFVQAFDTRYDSDRVLQLVESRGRALVEISLLPQQGDRYLVSYSVHTSDYMKFEGVPGGLVAHREDFFYPTLTLPACSNAAVADTDKFNAQALAVTRAHFANTEPESP